MKRRILSLILIITIITCTFGCGRSEIEDMVIDAQEAANASAPVPAEDLALLSDADGQFCLPYSTDDTFDPYTCTTEINRVIMPLIYDGLFSLDENYNYSNALCEEITTEDNQMFRITLREAYFSDGSLVTASDVVYSINAARESSSRFSSRLSGIIACYISEGFVCIETSSANPRLPALLDIPICKENNRSIGCGAYVMSNNDGEITLEVNTNWWQGLDMPYSTIYLRGYDNMMDLINAFNSKEIDLVTTDLTSSNAPGYSGDFDTWKVNSPTMVYLAFNTEQPVFSVASARQIIARGIDRESLVSNIYGTHATPVSIPFPPYSPYYDESLNQSGNYSTDAIEQIMEENDYDDINNNGYPDVETYYGWYDLNVDLVVNAESEYKVQIAQMIHDMFAELNIEVTIKALTYDEYIQTIQNGNFYMYLGEVTLSPDFNLYKLIGSNGSMNYGNYSSSIMSEHLQSGEYDAEFIEYFLESVPFTPILFKDSSVLTHRGTIADINATSENVFYNMHEWTVN